MQRQTWSNTLTYILTVAGTTMGFGATWRFPYLVGESGGGAYVLAFCLAMIFIGIPVILVENITGRKMMKNSADAFKGKWQSVGYMGLLGSFGIMTYYMVLGGFVLVYIFSLLFGDFNLSSAVSKEYAHEFYTQNTAFNPLDVGIFTIIFVVINWVILKRGIVDGIEKAVKFLTPTLFICLILVMGRSLGLDGAIEGVKFYLLPDFSRPNPKLFIDVLGQVFFALSLGLGVMVTLSSHLSKKENMIKTAIYTGVLSTLIAVLTGFMIFPTLFSANLAPDKGSSLIFETLPIAFSYIHFGTLIRALFFFLLLIAVLTTSLPIYQMIINVLGEKFRLRKKIAINLALGVIFILGNLPCILTYGPLNDVVLIRGKNIFGTFDLTSGNVLFVLTAFLCCIYVGWVLKKEACLRELSNEGELKSAWLSVWSYYIEFIVPLTILVIFYFGMVN